MKIPVATIVLAVLVTSAYFYFSQGQLYIGDDRLASLAFHYSSLPWGLFSQVFVHAGIGHLAGNVVPLLLFGVLLEAILLPVDIVLLFFLSSAVASTIFLAYSQAFLVGASAGVSGLIGASLALKPKNTIILLLVLPLFLFASINAASLASDYYTQTLEQQKIGLEKNVSQLVSENRTLEATVVNKSVVEVERTVEGVKRGKEREELIPSDLLVHVYGGVFGILYVFLLKRRLFERGRDEAAGIGEKLVAFGKGIKSVRRKS